jgi:hypothetical protein
MDALLSHCTILGQSSSIRFFGLKGSNLVEAPKNILAEYVYGNVNGMSKRKVCLWAETFKSGRPSLSEETTVSPRKMKFRCFRYTKNFS